MPDDLLPILERMALVALNFVHADGREPAIGDSDRDRQSAVALVFVSELLEVRSDRPLPAEPLLGRVGTPPAPGAVLPRAFTLADSGFSIVRSDDRSSSMIIDHGPKGGWHGHFDLLSFELFDHGELLVVDAGRWLYDQADPARDWVTSTPAHNTIAINGESHRAVEQDDIRDGAVEVIDYQAGAQVWRLHVLHRGYDHLPGAPVVERLIQTHYDGRFLFKDRIRADQPTKVSVAFLLPTEDVVVQGDRVVAQIGGARLTITLLQAEGWSVRTRPSWHSPIYATRLPATQLLIESSCRDCSLEYRLSAESAAAG
jgi:hypothetical protein